MTDERWSDVSGFEGWFTISSLGRLRRHKIGNPITGCDEFVQPTPHKIRNQTYSRVYLGRTDGRGMQRRDCYVHQLVLEAFVGPCPDGQMTCHNDGDSQNNRLDNLRYDTNRKNQLDRHGHGTAATGSKNPNALLTNQQVAKMRKLYATGRYTQAKLAARFEVTRACVCDVVRYKSYSNVGPDGEELGPNDYKEQRQARPAKTFTFCGQTMTIKEWAQEIGVTHACLVARLHRGWPLERALTTPTQHCATPDC